jgi:hypothetical protein
VASATELPEDVEVGEKPTQAAKPALAPKPAPTVASAPAADEEDMVSEFERLLNEEEGGNAAP